MTTNLELQQKAQKVREQAQQTQAPWLDGYDLVHLVDGILHSINTPVPDLDQVGAQLSDLAETLQNSIPEGVDLNAGEILQPLLESIGDLLGSLGDLGS